MTQFTQLIPITIRADAIPNEKTEHNKDYYEVMFGMKNGWWNFGEHIIVKLRVLAPMEDHIIFEKVNNMIVANPDDKISFEEAMNALKESNYDEFKAVDIIKNKRKMEAQEFIHINKSQFDKADESDDLYD